jgi:hypothetical protein
VTVKVPDEDNSKTGWKLQGQTIQVTILPTETVQQLKEKISKEVRERRERETERNRLEYRRTSKSCRVERHILPIRRVWHRTMYLPPPLLTSV